MPPKSMTGFGRGEAGSSERTWTVEIRTVNHRFLDQKLSLPRPFSLFEEPIKKVIADSLERGRIDVHVSVRGEVLVQPRLSVRQTMADQYHACLREIQERYRLEGGISLTDMLSMRDLISVEEEQPDMEAEWLLVRAAVVQALQECHRMREQEGQSLKNDLESRLHRFKSLVEKIDGQLPQILAIRQEELRERVHKLLDGVQLDPLRLAQECAIMADKSDVSEEVARLNSHIQQFYTFLASHEAVGRRLDFLLQEFLREVNTLCSKINNADIAQLGVEMKNEIEKLREQVQNIE